MTISVGQTFKTVLVTGDGSNRSFSFSPMIIYASDELEVITVVTSTGVETAIVEGTGATNYSVNVSSFPGTGTITYPAAGGTPIASTVQLIIKRVLDLEQATDLNMHGAYNADVLETQLDKLLLISIQQQEQLDRSFRLPVSAASTIGNEIPTPITGERYLRVNAGLTAYEWVALASTTTAVASDVTPQGVSLTTASAGTSDDFSRQDHSHLVDAYIKVSADIHNALNFS